MVFEHQVCLRYCIRKKTKLYTRCSVHKYFRTLSFDELEITESLFTACLFCNTQPNKKLTVKSGLRPSNHKIVSFWWLLSNHDLWCIWSLTDVIILSRPLLATISWIIQTRVSWSWVVVMAAFWICCAPGTNQRWTDLALIYKMTWRCSVYWNDRNRRSRDATVCHSYAGNGRWLDGQFCWWQLSNLVRRLHPQEPTD